MPCIRAVQFAIAIATLVVPMAAHATTYNGRVLTIRYGNDPNRISVQVASPHGGCGAGFGTWYTFTNKPLWAAAILAAMENKLGVSIYGTGVCTLGVEEV